MSAVRDAVRIAALVSAVDALAEGRPIAALVSAVDALAEGRPTTLGDLASGVFGWDTERVFRAIDRAIAQGLIARNLEGEVSKGAAQIAVEAQLAEFAPPSLSGPDPDGAQ